MEKPGDDAALAVAERRFTVPVEDLAYAGARRLDDFLVGVDEGHAQAPR
jgi:hypothetical protein